MGKKVYITTAVDEQTRKNFKIAAALNDTTMQEIMSCFVSVYIEGVMRELAYKMFE